ncbi:hypothetical protein BAY61_13730 [Prauserella marina]|uniref:Uncharacterized protein n=1 Tax=Prauserella marina TaxID=530584 RepID=A0A222VZ77_9PSEU|nr:hypothetical protein [Prauserella marina]ASR39258.1 hypothetical protein BAY61_13730 [Prauserella marina]PWV84189.1 hypothetical protein DES30_101206 [Prauserella marina]SDC28431.1 hypothetical protein SAMN05421630_1011131 [Prauserella marina]
MTAPPVVPRFAERLCDDAAVFPPGLMPLPDAVPAHAAHRKARYAAFVGPLVVAAPSLGQLATLLAPGDRLDLAITAPAGAAQAGAALALARTMTVDVQAVEIAVPADVGVAEFFTELEQARREADEVTVYVEVPRDARGPEVIAALADTGHRAKFRTGGVKAELYPGEAELATAITAVVGVGVAFKATAGLHHAVRNTDPGTGFEQHGFLNLLLATRAALDGADDAAVADVLAQRDADSVAAEIGNHGCAQAEAVRAAFVSFGTCSITEPLCELADLGLVSPALVREEGDLE